MNETAEKQEVISKTKEEIDELIKIEDVDLEDVGIGEDVPQMPAKRIVIENYSIENVSFGSEQSKKLVLKCKHPDSEKLIEISGVKYLQTEKVKTSGIWFKLDKEGKLPFNSAIANLLRFVKVDKVKGLLGEQMETELDKAGYLVLKAY